MIWLYLFVVIEKILFVEMWKQFTRPMRVYKTKGAYYQTCLTMVDETYPEGVNVFRGVFFFVKISIEEKWTIRRLCVPRQQHGTSIYI